MTDSYWCSEQRGVVGLAELANLDHHLRWRLRNLAVDPADGVPAEPVLARLTAMHLHRSLTA